MVKITIASGNILSFQGDAIIYFCDSELTHKEHNPVMQVFDQNNKNNDSSGETINQSFSQNKEFENNLVKELTSVGYCELGNAVITKGLGLRVKNLIFVPYVDHNDPQSTLSYVLFHKALRNALTLASLYGVETLAIPIFRNNIPKREFVGKLFGGILDKVFSNNLTEDEKLNITVTLVKDFNNPLREVSIYR